VVTSVRVNRGAPRWLAIVEQAVRVPPAAP
jgi:hypothetical protein